MTIYDFIRQQEVIYAKKIKLEDGWDWNMKDHLRRSFLYKNSQFEQENENRILRPNKNIVLGISNVAYRTEGFDVKDIELYVNDPDESYKSLLVKKFHDKWAPEKDIDTFIDDVVESYHDYGGTLSRDTTENRPEVIDLRSLAFCNQHNILTHPFAIKHILSPSQLREFTEWGQEANGATASIEKLIVLCKDEKGDEPLEIEVYEVHGSLPKDWLNDSRLEEESKKDLSQIQIVSYYKKQDSNEQGVTLFRKREPKLPFKFLPRDKIHDRALGRGGIEELFEPQIWTNWNEIKVTEMLEAASKVLGMTNDSTFAAKHPSGLKDMDNLEVLQIGEGKEFKILDTYPRNLAVFNDALERWQVHAQQLGVASEGLLTGDTNANMPFKLYEAKNIEDKSMHKFRQGKIAVFIDEIYRDWILPHIAKEIINDQKFLSDLTADEMLLVAKQIAIKQWNRYVIDNILAEKPILKDKDTFIQEFKDEYLASGNKKIIEIIKDELKDIPLDVHTNIAGKQKNLALLTDKVVSVLRQYLATPQIRQDPEMNRLLNIILESSGLSPIMFGSIPMQQQPQQGGTEALKQLSQVNQPTMAQ